MNLRGIQWSIIVGARYRKSLRSDETILSTFLRLLSLRNTTTCVMAYNLKHTSLMLIAVT